MQKKQNQKKRPNVKSKGRQQQKATEAVSLPQSVICGRNPVLEALKKNQSLNKVLLAAGQEAHFIKQIKELCKEKKVPCKVFIVNSSIPLFLYGYCVDNIAPL